MYKYLLSLMMLLVSLGASAQSVQQSGTVSSGHVAAWVSPGYIRDGGTSTGTNYLTSLGLTSLGGTPFCINTGAPSSSAYSQMCMGIDLTTGAYIKTTPYGSATALPFYIQNNGTTVLSISPTGGLTIPTMTTALTGILYGNGSNSPVTAYTPSGVLDLIGSTRGSLLERGASGWTAITPGSAGQVLTSGGAGADPSWTTVTGTGTVQSVQASGPSGVFTWSGGPVVNTGTLTATLNNQSANAILAGPTSGAATTPTFRALNANDLALGSNTIASASTTDLGSVASTLVTVSGSTGITSFGSTAPSGTIKIVNFTGSPTISQSASLVLSNFQNRTVVAGETMTFYSAGSGNWVQVDGSQAPVVPVGTMRNLKGAYVSATTATWIADELVLKNAVGNTPILIANFNKTLDISGTGAGKLDTGTAANSTWYYVYAIVKADGTQNIVATTTCTGNCTVYTGANMPAGYVASTLTGMFRTNGSAQIVWFTQLDNRVSFAYVNVLSGGTQTGSPTSVSIAAAVPPIAKYWFGRVYNSTAGQAVYVSGDSAGNVVYYCYSPGGTVSVNLFGVPIPTASTTYYYVTANSGTIDISGYSF